MPGIGVGIGAWRRGGHQAKPRVVASNNSPIIEGASIGSWNGTASIVGVYTGTPIYAVSGANAANITIDSSTGIYNNAVIPDFDDNPEWDFNIDVTGIQVVGVLTPLTLVATVNVTDVPAPVLSNATSLETGSSTATLTWDTNVGNGTLYVIGSADNVAPSAAQIIAGHDHTGGAAAYAHNQAVSGTGTQTVNATGLSASTTYYPFAVHVGLPSENSNVSAAASFTTEASAGMQGTTFWLATGDSRTIGTSTSPTTNYVDIAYNSGNLPWVTRRANLAVGGYTLTNLIAQGSAIDAYITNNPGFANYALSFLVGANSLIPGADYDPSVPGNVAKFLTDLATFCAARHSAGWTDLIACKELPAYTGSDATAYLAARATVNSAFDSWPSVHVEAVCPFGDDPTIGQDGDQTNATYYAGDLHPINPAHAIMASLMETSLLTIGSNVDVDPVETSLTTWSPSLKHANVTLSNGNRTALNSSPGSFYSVMSSRSHVTGQRYFELQLSGGDNVVCGLDPRYFINGSAGGPQWQTATAVPGISPYNVYPSQNEEECVAVSWVGAFVGPSGETSKVTLVNAPPNATSGTDIYTYAVDEDAGEVRIAKNAAPSLSDPVNYTFRPHTRWAIASSSVDGSTNTLPGTLNFTPPAGYSPF